MKTAEDNWLEACAATPAGQEKPKPPHDVLSHWACASLKVNTAKQVGVLAGKASRAGYQAEIRNEHLRALKVELAGALRIVDGILGGEL